MDDTLATALIVGYEDTELRPGVYIVDVLKDRIQEGSTNSEWRRFGEKLAQHVVSRRQNAVLVSTHCLEHFLVNDVERSDALNSASFYHEGRRYLVTSLQPRNLERTLPDIMESGEFVFGLNVWLCFFGEAETCDAKVLCDGDDTTFVLEMKRVISNLHVLAQIELTIELIAAISDGCEMLWFNPK
ncbi:unnamed protein product [Heligmosomoides polygyrus]|uniref:ATPase_AAA_core domain-containing protein n=1 Tax=Heligmosomoides polygyrus TaxID=6339 RepID=A0A183FZJ2_HELPZ|nr:unnamed protein product [Heligmosomoides polygyrus]